MPRLFDHNVDLEAYNTPLLRLNGKGQQERLVHLSVTAVMFLAT